MEIILNLTHLDIYIRKAPLMTMPRFRTVRIEPDVGFDETKRLFLARYISHKLYKVIMNHFYTDIPDPQK